MELLLQGIQIGIMNTMYAYISLYKNFIISFMNHGQFF